MLDLNKPLTVRGRAEDLFTRIEISGESVIDDLIASRMSEELFLDFKRSSDNGNGKRLSDIDRKNFARAISGFGNSEGGVIVWGVECSRDETGADVARMKFPIQDPCRFVSWLESTVSGCTIPTHQGIRNIAINRPSTADGFAITLIPKSNHAPHQVVGQLQYYIRAGSSFVPTPHAVLAGMFGRVPQPHVFHEFIIHPADVEGDTIETSVGLLVHNDGPGIASDLFANLSVLSFPEIPSKLEFDRPDQSNWSGIWSFGLHISLISQPGYRLPPEAQDLPLILKMSIAPPITHPVKIQCIVGAGNAPPYRFTLAREIPDIQLAYDEFMKEYRANRLTDDLRYKFAPNILSA